MTTDLDARYGRTAARRHRTVGVAIAAAVAVAVVLAAWLVWAGPLATGPTISSRNLGFDAPTEDRLILMFEVSADPGETVRCALEAQNAQHAIVGWSIVDLPPSEQRTRAFEEPIITSEQADTGLVSRCWLT